MLTKKFVLSRGYLFYGLFNFFYGGAVLSVWLTPLSVCIKLVLSSLIIVSFLGLMRRAKQFKQVVWIEKDDWVLYDRLGKMYPAKLLKHSVCTSWIIILNFSVSASFCYRSLLILPDEMIQTDFRRIHQCLLN